MSSREKLLRDIELIKGSIKKWESVVEGKVKGADIYNCPLCVEYQVGREYKCVACPIYCKTERKYCKNTPFDAYCDILYKEVGSESTVQAATEELNFLKELLHEYEEKAIA